VLAGPWTCSPSSPSGDFLDEEDIPMTSNRVPGHFEDDSQISASSRDQPELQSFCEVDDSLLKDLLYKILKDFEERFATDQVNSFRSTNLDALKRELKRIQDAQEREGTLQNLRRIERFVRRIEQFGQVLDNIMGTTEPIHFIWGPMKALLRVMVSCP
jgi:hypothetical protein